jgi:hypothetical protein
MRVHQMHFLCKRAHIQRIHFKTMKLTYLSSSLSFCFRSMEPEAKYAIEKITRHRLTFQKIFLYFVKRADRDEKYNSWEPASKIDGLGNLVRYHKQSLKLLEYHVLGLKVDQKEARLATSRGEGASSWGVEATNRWEEEATRGEKVNPVTTYVILKEMS